MARVRGCVRRIALAALDEGIRQEKEEAAIKAARSYDPILGSAARRRIRRAMSAAASASNDPLHIMQIASLFVARVVPESDYHDTKAIAAQRQQLMVSVGSPRKGPWLVVCIIAILGVLGVAAVFVPVFLRPFDPRTSAAGRALAEVIPELVVASHRSNADASERARAAATRESVRKGLGDDVVEKLATLIDSTVAVSGASAQESSAPAREAFTRATRDFNVALEQRKLPYFVDSDWVAHNGSILPYLLTFYVQREVVVQAGDKSVRTLHLWRLDELNVVHGVLGFTRPNTPTALVLLDQIESDLVRYALPALPEGEPLQLTDDETDREQWPWADRLATRGGQLMRRYVSSIPADDREGLDEVGRLLARRRALVRAWQQNLPTLRVPTRLIPELKYEQKLHLKVPHDQLYEWTDLHAELRRPHTLAAFERFRDRYVASVQRHEIQHRLDFDRGLVPVPPSICRMLNVEDPLGAGPRSLAARVRDELGAYLSSIAQAPDSPILDLVLSSRALFNKHAGGIYWYAALAILDGIADRLGIDARAITGRSVRRDEAARLLLAIAEHDDAAIRRAARETYEQEYGRKLDVLTETGRVAYTSWRH